MKLSQTIARRANWTLAGVAVLILFPILYVLSLGPAAWLVVHQYIPGEAFDAYATPVDFLAQRSPTIKHLWYSYLDFWAPTDPEEVERIMEEILNQRP